MRKFLIALLICYCSSLFAYSKVYYIPKWEYIQIEDTQIIYDTTYEKRAKLVASFLQYIITNHPEMKSLLKHDTIIIDASFISNNLNFNFYTFVENSFRKQNRSKLEYDPISLNNIQQLTDIPLSLDFNEFKKDILQYTYNLTRGRSLQSTKKILYPDWFETPTEATQTADLLSAFERSLQLNSYDNYRDFVLNNQDFTVNQLLNDSYLRKQPSKLYLGLLSQDYFMLEYGIEKWEKIVKDVEYFDNIIFPYSRAFKKHTGITIREFYRKTHKFYKKVFSADIASLPPDTSLPLFKSDLITKNRSYTHPHILKNGEIISLYSSFEETPVIVKIDHKNNIQELTQLGYSTSDKIKVNEPFVLWSQSFAYPNFYNFSNSRIAIFNLKDNTTSYIGNDSFYLEPALSPKKEILSVVSYNADFEQNIIFLNFPSEDIIRRIDNPNCYNYHDLIWLNQNDLLYIGENFLGQTAIFKYNLVMGKEERITPFSIDPIKDLTSFDNKIFFSYPVNDVFNICSLALGDSVAYRTFFAEISAGQPTVKDSTIIFSSNRYWGNQLRTVKLEPEFWTPITWNNFKDLTQECSSILNSEDNNNFQPEKLSPFYKLVDFKRVRLSYDQKEVFIYSLSQNPSRTFTLQAKTVFNFSNQGIKTSISNIISKHFPNILTEISHSNANFTFDKSEEITYGSSIKLPYFFGGGSYSGYLNGNLGLYHLDRYKSRKIFNFLHQADLYINYVKSDISFNFSKIKAQNNFHSPFGQNYLLSYKKSIDNDYSQQFYAMADYSLLGLRNSDSVVFENSLLMEKSNNKYLFGNMISNVYGYPSYPKADRIYKTTLKYYIPVAYPEKGIDNVIFLKRIYTSFFGSYGKALLDTPHDITVKEQNAVGNELLFDYNIMDSIEFQLGFRYSYAFNGRYKHQFDFFIPFSKF